MPSHRAQRSKAGPVAAALLLVVFGVATARQVVHARAESGDANPAAASVKAVDPTDPPAPESAASGEPDPQEPPGSEPSGAQKVVQGHRLQTLPDPVCGPKLVDETFTVVSFNIKSGHAGLDRFAAAIRNSGADIVLLQEVDKFRNTSRFVDQPAYLASRLGMESAFGANVLRGSSRFGRSQYGTAILSKYPIKSQGNMLLPNGRGGQQRGLLHAVVDVEGVELSVYGTHLQNIYDHLKMAQIRAIAPVLAADDRPKLFGGDLNSHPRSAVLGIAYTVLDDPWAAGVGVGSSLTHPATRPKGRIDFVLHAGEGLVPLRADTLAPGISDHRPTRAGYRLTGVGGEICKRPETPDLTAVARAALRDAAAGLGPEPSPGRSARQPGQR